MSILYIYSTYVHLKNYHSRCSTAKKKTSNAQPEGHVARLQVQQAQHHWPLMMQDRPAYTQTCNKVVFQTREISFPITPRNYFVSSCMFSSITFSKETVSFNEWIFKYSSSTHATKKNEILEQLVQGRQVLFCLVSTQALLEADGYAQPFPTHCSDVGLHSQNKTQTTASQHDQDCMTCEFKHNPVFAFANKLDPWSQWFQHEANQHHRPRSQMTCFN